MPESLASHSLQWKQSPYLLSPLDKRVTETALGQARHPGAELCSGLPLTPCIPVGPEPAAPRAPRSLRGLTQWEEENLGS